MYIEERISNNDLAYFKWGKFHIYLDAYLFGSKDGSTDS